MAPFLVSLPHCSAKIPGEIMPSLALDKHGILVSKDFGSEEVFGSLSMPVIKAMFSRFVVDLNRDPENRGAKGVVAKTDYKGKEIYKPFQYPDSCAIDHLVEKYFMPYHNRLDKMFSKPDIKFLFDCHSLENIGPRDAPDAGRQRKDIVISNNGGPGGESVPSKGTTSCSVEIVIFIKEVFENHGFSVSINEPYSGGFTTVHYGNKYPSKGALQMEINQGLFMDPGDTAPDPDRIDEIRIRMAMVFKEFMDYFS